VFGIGATELIVIMVVALLVFGPKRLPELARSLGRGMAEFRRASSDLRQTLQEAEPPADILTPPDPPSETIAPTRTPPENAEPIARTAAPTASDTEESSDPATEKSDNEAPSPDDKPDSRSG
jgi:sec-independent protein translocase protein TatB